MAVVADKPYDGELSEFDGYRALSSAAVGSLVAGVLSALSFLSSLFWVLPVFGLLLGIVAVARIRANPTELTGRKLALAGMVMSTLFWAGGASWLIYVYVTEVPDGYVRISYEQLQPEGNASAATVPASAMMLDGQRVFIKGYMYPGSQTTDIRELVLVRDQGACCFGGPTPKLTDMIQVKMQDPLRVDYSQKLRSFAGKFRVEKSKATGDLGVVLYHLEADYVK
jgi:hypothetical protein